MDRPPVHSRLLHSPYLQEVDELECMPSDLEEEVNTLVDVVDLDAVAVCIVLQDELLQVEEGTLVEHVLSELRVKV